MLWDLRPYNPKTDESFLFNSWLKSYKDSRMVAGVSNTVYYAEMHEVIKGVIKSPATTVIVACDQADPSTIFGYVVGQQIGAALIIHWVYVKHPFRNFGIGRHLESAIRGTVPHESIAYSLATKLTDVLTRKDAYVYNPFTLWKK